MVSEGDPHYCACCSSSLPSSDASLSSALTSSSSFSEVVKGGSIGSGSTLSDQAEIPNSDVVQNLMTTDESTDDEPTPASASEVHQDVNDDWLNRAIDPYSLPPSPPPSPPDLDDKSTGILMGPYNLLQAHQGLPPMSREKRVSLQQWASSVSQASHVEWANSAVNPCNLLESRLLPERKPKLNYCPDRARLEGWLAHQFRLDKTLARDMHKIDWRCVPRNIWVSHNDLREDLTKHPDLLERCVNHNVDHANVLLAAEKHLMALHGTDAIGHGRRGRRIDLNGCVEQLKHVRCLKHEVLPLIGSVYYTHQILRMLGWKHAQLYTEPHTFYTTTLTNIPLRTRRVIANQPELLSTALKLLLSEYEVFPERFQDGDLHAIVQPLSTPLYMHAQRLRYSMSCSVVYGGSPKTVESHDVADPLPHSFDPTKASSLKPLEQIIHLLTPKGFLPFPPPIGSDPVIMMVQPGGPPPTPSDTSDEDAARLDAEVLGSDGTHKRRTDKVISNEQAAEQPAAEEAETPSDPLLAMALEEQARQAAQEKAEREHRESQEADEARRARRVHFEDDDDDKNEDQTPGSKGKQKRKRK